MDYIKGMTWGWVGTHGTWKNKNAEDSMQKMKELGVTWTAIAFQGLQETAHSTAIKFNTGTMVRDDEVEWAIETAA